MKIISFSFLLCLFSVLGLFAQDTEQFDFNYQVIYELTYRPDSTSGTVQKIDMELLLNPEASLFRSVMKGESDSALYAEKRTPMSMMVVRPVHKFQYQIVKKGELIRLFDAPFGPALSGKTDVYYYEEAKKDLAWQIKSDTLTVNGMACQRADLSYGGREWTAWFSPEIPISDGPYKFCGLPGLIISISDSTESWSFEATNINNVNKEVIIHFEDWLKFSPKPKKALLKERREYQNNLFATLEAAGNNFANPTDKEKTHEWFRDNVARQMAEDNNWIELDF